MTGEKRDKNIAVGVFYRYQLKLNAALLSSPFIPYGIFADYVNIAFYQRLQKKATVLTDLL